MLEEGRKEVRCRDRRTKATKGKDKLGKGDERLHRNSLKGVVQARDGGLLPKLVY